MISQLPMNQIYAERTHHDKEMRELAIKSKENFLVIPQLVFGTAVNLAYFYAYSNFGKGSTVFHFPLQSKYI